MAATKLRSPLSYYSSYYKESSHHVPSSTSIGPELPKKDSSSKREKSWSMFRPNRSPPRVFAYVLLFSRRISKRVSRLPRLRKTYGVMGVLFLILWVAIFYIFQEEMREYTKSGIDDTRFCPLETEPWSQHNELWRLQGRIHIFDPPNRRLTISWQLFWVDRDFPSNNYSFGSLNVPRREIGIYQDQSLVPERKSVEERLEFQANSGYTTKRIGSDTAIPVAIVGLNPYDRFLTDTIVGWSLSGNDTTTSSNYPFEQWSGHIVLVASYLEQARVYNATNSFGTNIDCVDLGGALMNWKITMVSENTCFNQQNTSDPCHMAISIKAERAPHVKFSAVVGFFANWIAATLIFILTCESVFINRRKPIEKTHLLSVCFTALFALPSIRAIFPGAPEFGSWYLIGIIPNVVTITVSITILVIAILCDVERVSDLHV